jgi:exopolyphosphatase / guanosine-5'-triphosphate,3'-diphosphate pyrophosphatase
MQRVGIVDLGSNTARMVVYHYEPGEWFQVVDELREPLRLGEGLGRKGELAPDAVERAVAMMELFVGYARANQLEMQVIGTSALRDASNGASVLKRLAAIGLDVDVLSGEDEAQLGVLAVANGFAVRDAWVMDLGGGSAQLARMESRRLAEGAAYPLGAVRLTERHRPGGKPWSSVEGAIEDEAAHHLAAAAKAIRVAGVPVIAMGGTVRNLVRAVQKRVGYPLRLTQGYFLSRDDLEDVTARLLRDNGRVPGVHPDRADIIPAGALVFRWLVRMAKLPGLWISGHGVRQGLFYRRFLPPPHLIEDLRTFHVANLLHRHHPPSRTHGVRRLAARIFDQLTPLHGLGEAERQLLDAGAALRDIGKTVNHFRHYRHAAYMVQWSDLSGFTHREQALLALLARFHRGGAPKLGDFEILAQPGDKQRLVVLTACLRLAQAVSGFHGGHVRDVRMTVRPEQVEVRIEADHEPLIERWEAHKQSPFFAKAFGRQLVVTAAAG